MTFNEILMPVTSTTMLATAFHARIHDVSACQIGSESGIFGSDPAPPSWLDNNHILYESRYVHYYGSSKEVK